MKNKKGVSISQAPGIVLTLGILAMIGMAVLLALTAFKQSNCTGFWNATTEACYTNTSGVVILGSYVYNVTRNGQSSLLNLSAQTPTLGTIIGVALIIAVVVGAFAMFMGKKDGAL